VKVSGDRAENMAVTTHSKTPKKTPKSASQAKPVAAAKTGRTTRQSAAKPVLAKQTRAKSTVPVTVPRPVKPLIALARRRDGSALSFSERLAELRHKQFKHAGPVCHSCRMSASELARASAPTAIAG
jgi:hypothetical protein